MPQGFVTFEELEAANAPKGVKKPAKPGFIEFTPEEMAAAQTPVPRRAPEAAAAPVARTDEKSGVIDSMLRSSGQMIGSAGSTLRDIGAPNVGRGIQDFGDELAARHPSSINSLGEALGDLPQTGKEAVSELAPQVAVGTAGGAAGAAVGALGGPLAPITVPLGTVVGAGLPTFVQEYGSIREDQRERGTENVPLALAAATGATALDLLGPVGKFGMKLGRQLVGKAVEEVAEEGAKRGITELGKRVATAGIKEGATEVVQTGIERVGSQAPLTNQEAIDDYGVSGIKGAIGGSAVGTMSGPKRSRFDADRETGEPSDLLSPEPEVVRPPGTPTAPRGQQPGLFDLDEVLDNGIAPTETGGNPVQISSQNARGKYQLLPATAKQMATELGVPYDEDKLLNDPAYNRSLAKQYMSNLLNRYDGDMFKAVTAYHAGEGNTDRWIERYGDPAEVGHEAWLDKVGKAGNPRSADYARKVFGAMGRDMGGSTEQAQGPVANTDMDDELTALTQPSEITRVLRNGHTDADGKALNADSSILRTANKLSVALKDADVEAAQAFIDKETASIDRQIAKLAEAQTAHDEAKGGMLGDEVTKGQAKLDDQLEKLVARSNVLKSATDYVAAFTERLNTTQGDLFAPEPQAAPEQAAVAEPAVAPEQQGPMFPTGEPQVFAPAQPAADTELAAGLVKEEARAAEAKAIAPDKATDANSQMRQHLLETVLSDPETKNPMARFRAELRKRGIDPTLVDDEGERIGKFEDAREAFNSGDQMIEPSAPDESGNFGIPERKAAPEFQAAPEDTSFQAAAEPAPKVEAEVERGNVRDRALAHADTLGSSQRAWFLRGADAAQGISDASPPSKGNKPHARWFKQGQDFVAAEEAHRERERAAAAKPPTEEKVKQTRSAAIKAKVKADREAKAKPAAEEPAPAPVAIETSPEPSKRGPGTSAKSRESFRAAVDKAVGTQLTAKQAQQLLMVADMEENGAPSVPTKELWPMLDEAVAERETALKPKARVAETDVAAATKQLRAALDKMGLHDVGVKMATTLDMIAEHGEEIGPKVAGDFDAATNLIRVAMGRGFATLDHEAMHAMRAMGLFNPAEWETLVNAASRSGFLSWAERNYPEASEDLQQEEAVAELFAKWHALDRSVDAQSPAHHKLLKRIKDLLTSILNTFKKAGYNNADAIFHAIRRGDVGKRARGEKTAGPVKQMYAGPNAQTADKVKLIRAVIKSFGSSRDTTGWFKGADGKWRFEIDDSTAKWKAENWNALEDTKFGSKVSSMKLGDLLDHPALFEAYPELRDTEITKIAPLFDFGRDQQGSFNPANNRINITPYAQNPLSTLLHEVQHWVQSAEGFDNGGNPAAIRLDNISNLTKLRDFYDRHLSQLDNTTAHTTRELSTNRQLVGALLKNNAPVAALYKAVDDAKQTLASIEDAQSAAVAELRDAYTAAQDKVTEQRADRDKRRDDKKAEYDKHVAAGNREAASKAHLDLMEMFKEPYVSSANYDYAAERAIKDKFAAQREKARDAVRDAEQDLSELGGTYSSLTYDLYQLIGGEREARDVQKRQHMDAEGRRANDPYSSEGIRDEETIPSPLKQIANSQDPSPDIKRSTNVLGENIKEFAKQAPLWLSFTEDIANLAAKAGLPSAKRFIELHSEGHGLARQFEERLAEIKAQYESLPVALRGNGPRTVNKFLYESRMKEAWGYQPKGLNVTVDPDMAKKFNALPREAQDVVKATIQFNRDARRQLLAASISTVNAEYDPLIDAAPDAATKKSYENAKKAAMAAFSRLHAARDDIPYAPLKRSGDHVVLGMSKEYEQAKIDNDAKAMEELRSKPEHYFVDFRDTTGEAKALADRVRTKFHNVQSFARDAVTDAQVGGNELYVAFGQLRGKIASALKDDPNDTATKQLYRLATDLYFHSLADTSARKAELKADLVNAEDPVTGEAIDMMKAFVSRGQASAAFVAALHNNSQMQAAITAMEEEAGATTPGRDKRQRFRNELMWHYVNNATRKPNRMLSKILFANSVQTLLLNPAYHVFNATQAVMFSQPMIAAKVGYPQAHAALIKAYGDIAPLVSEAGIENRIDFTKVPADVKDVVAKLVKRGRIDSGLTMDLGKWEQRGDGPVAAIFNKTSRILSRMPQTVENVNRLVTGIAAYRAMKAKGATDEAAYEFASKTIYDTHGDYSGFNTPRVIAGSGDIGRVAFQFRKFQLIMASLTAKMLHNSFKGASPEEKWVARRQLAFTLAHVTAVAGLAGFPGAGLIGYATMQAIKALDDDDDKKRFKDWDMSLEDKLKELLGDGPLADMLYKGAPYSMLDTDTSGKLGMTNMLALSPFADVDKSLNDRDAFFQTVGQVLAGALGGNAARAVTGYGFAKDGDYYRAIESLLPNGLTGAMKAVRLHARGVTSNSGDTLVGADNVTGLDKVLTGLGFPARGLADVSTARSRQYEMNEHYSQMSMHMKRRYNNAAKAGDTATMRKLRGEWADMQSARKKDGLKAQPLSGLIKGPGAQRKREAKTVGGVQYTNANKAAVADLTD